MEHGSPRQKTPSFETVGDIVDTLEKYIAYLNKNKSLFESTELSFVKDRLRVIMQGIPELNPAIPPSNFSPILELPLDLLSYCFSFLEGTWREDKRDISVLDALCRTCKKLRDAAWNDPLWKYLYDKDFGGSKLEWQSWRKAYKETALEFSYNKNLKWVISQGYRVLLRKYLRHQLTLPSGLYYMPTVGETILNHDTSLLMIAVECSQLGCVQELLDFGVEAPYGKAIEIAIEFEETAIYETLICHILTKLDIDTYSKLDLLHECLLCAVRCSNLEYAKYMIKQVKKENMQLFAMLANYEQPRSRNTELYVVQIPLELAAERNDIHFVVMLLEEGFSDESSFSRPQYSDDVEKLIKASRFGSEAFGKTCKEILGKYPAHQRIAENQQIPLDFDSSEFTLGPVIGVGNFSTVRSATFRNSQVAVKLINKINHSIQKEIDILRSVFHPNIVHFFGVTKLKEKNSDFNSKYCIVLELVDTVLYDAIHVDKRKLFVQEKLSIALGIAYAMQYLHKMQIVHNDLTSKNVLLSKQNVPKVIDFGQSANLRDLSRRNNTGALPWCSPEVLNGETCSPKSDCYSYGVILWEIFGEQSPISFDGMSPLQLAHAVAEENFRFPIPSSVPNFVKQLIEECWSPPFHRPSFEVIIKQLREDFFKAQ